MTIFIVKTHTSAKRHQNPLINDVKNIAIFAGGGFPMYMTICHLIRFVNSLLYMYWQSVKIFMINLHERMGLDGIKLATPGSAVRLTSVIRHATDCTKQAGIYI